MYTPHIQQSRHSTKCNSFLPGHRLHWTQWKRVSCTPPVSVLRVVQDDDTFEIVVVGQASLRWRHHDPSELRNALDTAQFPIVASPQWRMLRIDGVWFNCVPAEADITLCV